jgi:hypothetical protein
MLLFSGLTLGPDTYYLTIASTGTSSINSGSWKCTDTCNPGTATITLAPGVTQNSDRYTQGTNPYTPANSFILSDRNLIYAVIAVPEPGTMVLLGMGLLAIVGCGLRLGLKASR